MKRPAWTPGASDPTELSPARLALHHAAQIVSAAGSSLLPKAADDSHRSLHWSEERRALVSHPLPSGHSVALGLLEFAVEVRSRAGEAVASIPLHGLTPDAALDALAKVLIGCGAAAEGTALRAPEWDMPPMAGPVLKMPPATYAAELSTWYGAAHRILEPVQKAHAGASPIIVWPHHFDIATLIAIDPDPHAAGARSVGVGLSPGDGTFDEPYFYITPYPAPATVPSLVDVAVQSAGWTGYVIRGSTIAGWPEQTRVVRASEAVERAVGQALILAGEAGG